MDKPIYTQAARSDQRDRLHRRNVTDGFARKRGIQILIGSVTITVNSGHGAGLSTGGRQRASYAGGRTPVDKPYCAHGLILFLFAHRLALKVGLVRGTHDVVDDPVGEGRISKVSVPVRDGQLAGDRRGARTDAIVEQATSLLKRNGQPAVVVTTRSRRANHIRGLLKLPSAWTMRSSSKSRGRRT